MSDITIDQKTEAKKPVALKDDELEAVAAGSTSSSTSTSSSSSIAAFSGLRRAVRRVEP